MNKSEKAVESQLVGLIASRVLDLRGARYAELIAAQGGPLALIDSKEAMEELPALSVALDSKAVRDRAVQELADWDKRGIRLVALGEETFPTQLAQIFSPPAVLFYRGSLESLCSCAASVAVIGSRNANIDGCKIATRLSRSIASAGGVVVSGLALGIDAAAHRGALEARQEGRTVAVMGHGLDRIYPPRNAKVGEEIIASGGALISQFEPGTPPYPNNFLNRNQIIAGLSVGVLVVQAAARSGALSTARHALENGRDVMAIPGSIDDQRHEGTNRLIQSGAALITSFDDIVALIPELRPPAVTDARVTDLKVTELQGKLISRIRAEREVHIENLVSEFGSQSAFYSELISLELAGVLERTPGGYVSLSNS